VDDDDDDGVMKLMMVMITMILYHRCFWCRTTGEGGVSDKKLLVPCRPQDLAYRRLSPTISPVSG